MKTTKLGMWFVLTAVTSAGVMAQGRPPPAQPPQQRAAPAEGFWPTERLIDLAINRITDHMAELYALDADQVWNTRDAIKARFPQWLQENRPQLQALIDQYLEAVMGDEPPTPQEVADWSARATPLFEQFLGLVDETTEDMRGYLTDSQQVLLDGQKAAFQVGANYMRQRLATWKTGGYDWKTEWPQSDTFREKERQRQTQLEREAERQKLRAMGLNPDTTNVAAVGSAAPADNAPAGEPAAGGKRPVQTRPGAPAAKDEWTSYVDDFIKRYQLDEAQQNSARKFLRDQQELRDRYLQRHLSDIKALEGQQKTARNDEEKGQIKADYERLNRPIDGYFQRLKDRLETLPTRKQRAAAAQTDAANQARAPVSEERKSALKAEMESRAKAGKTERPEEAETQKADNEGAKE